MTTLSNETKARLRAEVERNTAPFRDHDIAGQCKKLRRRATFYNGAGGRYSYISDDLVLDDKAADTLERQAAEIKKLREALTNIQIEAERENGRWNHLKRVIAINARAALTGEDR